MERVMKKLANNSIIILFAVIVFASTFYMGLSERKLSCSSANVVELGN